jgi:hypothetical protein
MTRAWEKRGNSLIFFPVLLFGGQEPFSRLNSTARDARVVRLTAENLTCSWIYRTGFAQPLRQP